MRKLLRFAFVLFLSALLFFFPCVASAEEPKDVVDGLTEDFKEALPEEMGELVTDPEKLGERVGVRAVFQELLGVLSAEGDKLIGFFALCLGISFTVSAVALSSSVSGVCEGAVGAVSTAVVFGRIYPDIIHARDCLTEAAELFGGLIPVLMGINAASGSVGVASCQAAAMSLSLSLVSGVCVRLILPVAALGAVTGLLSAFGEEASGVGNGVRNLFFWLTGIVSVFLGGLSALQTVIASAADTAGLRAAKYGAANLIPIVGGTVSAALSTLTAGVEYLKSAAGVSAVLAILSVLLSPLAVLLAYRGAISLSITVGGFFGADRAGRILSALRSAVDTVLAVFTLCMITFILQLVLFTMGGARL